MGLRSVKFGFTPKENEQIETVIKVPKERRSIIHGTVKNCHNKPIEDAIVKLYKVIKHHGKHVLKPLTHTFTDKCGHFAFGPLQACKHYVIKVWVNDVKIRELIIHPDNEDCYPHNSHCQNPPAPQSCSNYNDNEYIEYIEDLDTANQQISEYSNDDTDLDE